MYAWSHYCWAAFCGFSLPINTPRWEIQPETPHARTTKKQSSDKVPCYLGEIFETLPERLVAVAMRSVNKTGWWVSVTDRHTHTDRQTHTHLQKNSMIPAWLRLIMRSGTCRSRREDGLSCRHGVKHSLTHARTHSVSHSLSYVSTCKKHKNLRTMSNCVCMDMVTHPVPHAVISECISCHVWSRVCGVSWKLDGAGNIQHKGVGWGSVRCLCRISDVMGVECEVKGSGHVWGGRRAPGGGDMQCEEDGWVGKSRWAGREGA